MKVVDRDGFSGSKLLIGLVGVSESVLALFNGGLLHCWLPTAVSVEGLVNGGVLTTVELEASGR